ncbi:MAG: IS1634 family transposase [Saprospiraceae bacterium]
MQSKEIMGKLEVIRVDDIPLLYTQIEELGLQELIDKIIKPHGNWRGLSIGYITSIWLCYLLSESDHRISAVESWVRANYKMLRALSGQGELRDKDFTDDKLEEVLDMLSDEEKWREISNGLNRNSLEIYDLDAHKTIRLDAAPMQGHHNVKKSNLFQYGYSKHHNAKLGMLKVMLACIDNEVNGFGYPLAHITVSGEQADDGLYIPLIDECEQTFALCREICRKLYVGDGKMGSQANRYHIWKGQNDYLVPLSKIQLTELERSKCITQVLKKDYKKVYKTDKAGKKILVAQGFEREVEVSYENKEGKIENWKERQVFVLSTSYSQGQQKSLDQRLKQTTKAIKDLLVRKQGKKRFKKRKALQEAINNLLREKGLTDLLEVSIQERRYSKEIRAYKDRPARKERWSTFQLEVVQNKKAIAARKKNLGWQIYGTTVAKEKLDFENIVWKYRHQIRVESRFNDLRNKVVPLVPIFLKKDNRVEALINILMICLKVCAIMEFKVAKALKQTKAQLDNIYEGNPKRSTATPTAKRLLKQFEGISIGLINTNQEKSPSIMLTELSPNQLKILDLLSFKSSIYTNLPRRIKLFFSHENFSET